MRVTFPSENSLTWQGQRSNTWPMDSTHNPANGASSDQSDHERSPGTSTNRLDFDPLPYVLLVKGRFWYFRHTRYGTHRLPGEYRDERFMVRYAELLGTYSIDAKRERLRVPPSADRSQVYFIGWRGGPVKIGIAVNHRQRLASLQSACPYELEILASVPGGRALEKTYHRRFATARMMGEWFERHPAIESEIERLTRGGRRLPSPFKVAA